MIVRGIVTHGGVGAPADWSDGCRRAAQAGFEVLQRGGCALDAVVEAVRILEDDPRFNAGTGSVLRLDGRTIEMDAGVMTSEGRIGAVAAIRDVKNPIAVARAVMDSPHVLLCGEGATRFARRMGFEPFDPTTEKARERHREMMQKLREGADLRRGWRAEAVRRLWNFEVREEEVLRCDTVGAVALDERGLLAAAASTGGASPMLLGRVGDSPLPGCGFFASPSAAAAATGIGEEIIRRTLSKSVCDRIAQGEDVAEACRLAVEAYPAEIPVGVIAISRRGAAAADNREMAHAILVEEA